MDISLDQDQHVDHDLCRISLVYPGLLWKISFHAHGYDMPPPFELLEQLLDNLATAGVSFCRPR